MSRRLRRLLLVAVLSVASVVALGLTGPGTAAADPIVPPGATPAVRALAEANARAADATEAATGAREQLAVRQREADRTRQDTAAARSTADRTRAEKDRAFVGRERGRPAQAPGRA